MQTVLRIKQLENDDFIIKVGYQNKKGILSKRKKVSINQECVKRLN